MIHRKIGEGRGGVLDKKSAMERFAAGVCAAGGDPAVPAPLLLKEERKYFLILFPSLDSSPTPLSLSPFPSPNILARKSSSGSTSRRSRFSRCR